MNARNAMFDRVARERDRHLIDAQLKLYEARKLLREARDELAELGSDDETVVARGWVRDAIQNVSDARRVLLREVAR